MSNLFLKQNVHEMHLFMGFLYSTPPVVSCGDFHVSKPRKRRGSVVVLCSSISTQRPLTVSYNSSLDLPVS